ncbi:carboxylate--amine ligase [Luteimicrobium album]|uniref:Carboxylate--amine ligase n=1 Tax=Luteimicrobium album TaxID=1054550 RepID=A0ABQ6I7S1_9MICO|nr:hypothetical protein [Luteimicrobium album]GMA25819.1 carboxylate--amine ligase [Luteimicrobium album]
MAPSRPRTYGNDDFVPVILGTGINAYNIARSLHQAFGVRSLALGRFALRETAHSRILDVRAYRSFEEPDFVVATLQELAAELGDRTLVLVPTIEFYTNVVLDHRAELDGLYRIPLVDKALAQRLINKTDFYRTLADLGVPHPATVIVTPQTAGDSRLGEDLPFPYPVILKPSDTDVYPRLHFAGKQKVYLLHDAAGVRETTRRIYAAGYDDDLVVQEYITGDESVMRVANTYSDQHGRMQFVSVGQVALTEYNPALVGNNNAIVTFDDPELASSIRNLLDAIGYVGAANFDVMHDRRTGTSKILELNLRQGATSYYTMAAGGNLARYYVDDLVYGRSLTPVATTEERLWLNVPYPVVRHYAPASVRGAVRAAARRGRVHTLRYRPDRSFARALDIARVDLRHTLDYVKFAKVRLNR